MKGRTTKKREFNKGREVEMGVGIIKTEEERNSGIRKRKGRKNKDKGKTIHEGK